MTSATFKSSVKFPTFNFQEDLSYIAEKIFIPILQQNIEDQISIDGSSFPELEPSTIANKNRQTFGKLLTVENRLSKDHFTDIAGYGKQKVSSKKSKDEITQALSGIDSKILIQTRKLINSFLFRNSRKNSVIIYLNSERADIGVYLQVDGMGKKKKHFNFFGINSKMEENGVAYMKQKIQRAIQNVK